MRRQLQLTVGRRLESALAACVRRSGTIGTDDGVSPSEADALSPAAAKLKDMQDKYGEATYALFRPLYVDLVDEMRSEATTRPPAPMSGWDVRYDDETNRAVFSKSDDTDAKITAFCPVVMANPPKLHPSIYFVDFFPIDVYIERNGVVMHFAVGAVEKGLHVRNVRVHRRDALEKSCGLSIPGSSPNSKWAGHNLLYDGPCLDHLEMAFKRELYDILMDYGVTTDFVVWAAQWTSYLEHQQAVRWMLNMMEVVLPPSQRGDEGDFLSNEEAEKFSSSAEEWLAPRYL